MRNDDELPIGWGARQKTVAGPISARVVNAWVEVYFHSFKTGASVKTQVRWFPVYMKQLGSLQVGLSKMALHTLFFFLSARIAHRK